MWLKFLCSNQYRWFDPYSQTFCRGTSPVFNMGDVTKCVEYILSNVEKELHIAVNSDRLNFHNVIRGTGYLTVLVIKYLENYQRQIVVQSSMCSVTVSYYKECLSVHKLVESELNLDKSKLDELYSVLNFYSNSVFHYAQQLRVDTSENDFASASDSVIDETERGLYCLGGGCLAEIRNRILGKGRNYWLKAKGQVKRHVFGDIVAALKMDPIEKSSLPDALRSRDRGGMIFPKSVLLPFVRHVNGSVMSYATSGAMKAHGKNFIKVSD